MMNGLDQIQTKRVLYAASFAAFSTFAWYSPLIHLPLPHSAEKFSPDMRSSPRESSAILSSNGVPFEMVLFPLRALTPINGWIAAIPSIFFVPGHTSLCITDNHSDEIQRLFTGKTDRQGNLKVHNEKSWLMSHALYFTMTTRQLLKKTLDTMLSPDWLSDEEWLSGYVSYLTGMATRELIDWTVLNSISATTNLPPQISVATLQKVMLKHIENPNKGAYIISSSKLISTENNNCRSLVAEIILETLTEEFNLKIIQGEIPSWSPDSVLVDFLSNEVRSLSLIEWLAWKVDDGGFYGPPLQKAMERLNREESTCNLN